MTQPVITGQPILAPGSEAGEPTMEELAALLPEPLAETFVEPGTEAPADGTETAPAKPAELKAEPDAAEPTEVDAAAARAAKAAAHARAGSRRFAEMKAQQADAQASVQRAAREAEQLRQENAAAKLRDEAYKKDPYAALKAAGMTDRDLAERALRENTPEAVTQRLQERIEASEARAAALETRLANEQKAQRQAAAIAQAEANFAKIADDEATYPQLSQLTTPAQLDVVRLALARITANGHDVGRLSDAQTAEAAEKYLAMMRKAGKTAPAAVVGAKPAAVAKPSGVTLTNKQAQTRTVAPANWDDLSDEQQIAHIATMLPDPT